MQKLELKDCFIIHGADNPDNTVGGINFISSRTWWQRPTFLSQLSTPTFGALKEFVNNNREDLYEVSGYARDFLLLFDESLKDRPDDEEVIQPYNLDALSRGIIRGGFSLFEEPEEEPEPSKPSVFYDGYAEVRGGAYYFFWYHEGSFDDPEEQSNGVQAYNYSPEVFRFYSLPKEKTKRYFGLELEINTEIPWLELQKVLLEVEPKQEDFLYAMHDGSIGGDMTYRYELVTHPMTPRRMRKEFTTLFSKLEKLLTPKGKKLSEVFNCNNHTTGLHIHVSRDAFLGSTRTHLNKFSMIWNSQIPSMIKFASSIAGRNILGHQYCAPSHDYVGRTLAWRLKNEHTSGRYVACNPTTNTIEVRAFKGKPTLSNVLCCIDSVEALLDFTGQAPYSVFNRHFSRSFYGWLKTQNKTRYRTLRSKLKENAQCA
jgi:hypothetical protein